MNCKEVEFVLTDLARGVVEDEAALGHLRVCGRCGERLAAEKRLSEGLAAWARASSGERAPAEVEAKLRAAFRERVRVRRGRRWIGVAAVGAIAAAAMVVEFVRVTEVAPLPMPPKMTLARPAEVGRAEHHSLTVMAPKLRRPARTAAKLAPRPEAVEVGTDFLPVAQDDGWTPLEGGRLVRVELPKSALGVFGLPIDEERGPERVQADVMVSHDGLLRAIRFVH